MRKVNRRDEPRIDVKSIEARESRFNAHQPSDKLRKKFAKLQDDLKQASKFGNIVLMKKLYAFVDFYMEEVAYPSLVCRKGCGYCCKIPATVTCLEAAYLYRAVGKKLKLKFVEKPEAVERTEVDYCPFFDRKTATCAGYEFRPLNCRTFGTFDSWENCVDDQTEHNIHTWQSSNALEYVRDLLDNIHLHNGYKNCPDIRDWVKEKDR